MTAEAYCRIVLPRITSTLQLESFLVIFMVFEFDRSIIICWGCSYRCSILDIVDHCTYRTNVPNEKYKSSKRSIWWLESNVCYFGCHVNCVMSRDTSMNGIGMSCKEIRPKETDKYKSKFSALKHLYMKADQLIFIESNEKQIFTRRFFVTSQSTCGHR